MNKCKENKQDTQKIIQVHLKMATSYSCRCSSTMMMKSTWLTHQLSYTHSLNLSILQASQNSQDLSQFFSLKNWCLTAKWCPKTTSYVVTGKPSQKKKSYNYLFQDYFWHCGANFASLMRYLAQRRWDSIQTGRPDLLRLLAPQRWVSGFYSIVYRFGSTLQHLFGVLILSCVLFYTVQWCHQTLYCI